jgi:hypothetical protein
MFSGLSLRSKKEEVEVAVVVRTKFRSLVGFVFTMGFLIICIVDTIPSFMEQYAKFNPIIGIPLALGFIIFMWEIGNMIAQYVIMYNRTRSTESEIVILAKNVHASLIFEGKVEEVEKP